MEIKEEEYEMVKKNLEKYSIFEETLSREWIEKHILNDEKREQKHPLFWELLLPEKVSSLAKMLTRLSKESYFDSIVAKLKRYRDKDNFHALVTELIVLYYYKQRENETFKIVTYEPSVPDKTTKNDILIEIDGEPYYFEIFALTEDIGMRRENAMTTTINKELNKIKEHPFVITYSYLEMFSEGDVPQFIEFVQKKIRQAKDDNAKYFEYDFIVDGMKKAVLKLYREDINQGFVGAITYPVREIKSDGRIKAKILDKTEQFNPYTKNILVINLIDPFSSIEDFKNAVLGKLGCMVGYGFIREPNGVMHDALGRGNIVSCFIGFERGIYEQRVKIFNKSANNTIDRKYWDLL